MKFSDAYKSFLLDRAAYCSGKTLITYEGHLGLLSIYLSIVYLKLLQIQFNSPGFYSFSDFFHIALSFLREKFSLL